jgi:uridine kinase
VAPQSVLHLADGQLTEVEDAGREHRVGPGLDSGRKVGGGARSTAGDQGHADLPPDGLDQGQVEAIPGAVGVHRVEQDLPGAQLGRPHAPRDRVKACPTATAMGGHLELAGSRTRSVASTPDISRQHEDLRTETIRDIGNQAWAGYRCGIDSHLVGPRAEQKIHVSNLAHAPTDGQRDEDLLGGPADHLIGRLSVAAAGGDVKKGQLVSALLVITFGQLNGIAGIAQVLEVDPLDHSTGVNIKAGDDPYRDTHPASLPSVYHRVWALYSPDMHITAADEAIAAALLIINRARTRCGTTKVVAVDGPSGAGKTDFAAALAEHLPSAQLLHMDDLYPGWNGLAKAVADLHDQILAPLANGQQAAYRRWDWEHDRPAEWHSLPARDLLLVEGVGSGSAPGWQLESALIWLEADHDERFRRAVERDGESYLPHWRRWAACEDDLFAVDGTRSRADLIIDTSP